MGPALRGAVADLCDSQLIREVRRVPRSIFRFRHALIQEAIYGSLLQNDRSQLHARAAWGTEAASAGRVEEMAAVIGHHFAMAGETERAVHHLAVAGKYAAARFAVDEAVSSYRHAIEIADEDRAGPAAVTGSSTSGTNWPRSCGAVAASMRHGRRFTRPSHSSARRSGCTLPAYRPAWAGGG